MEMTKVVKPFIRRGANTFGNIVYLNLIVTKVHPLKRYRPSHTFCISESVLQANAGIGTHSFGLYCV